MTCAGKERRKQNASSFYGLSLSGCAGIMQGASQAGRLQLAERLYEGAVFLVDVFF